MKGLDTNVLVRFLAQDDVKQSAQATRYIAKHCTVEDPCCIGLVTLCELVWVLESHYARGRDDIAAVIEHVLETGELDITESLTVRKALADFKRSNVEFPDHLIARVNAQAGCEATATFDKKAAKQPDFELLRV